MSESTCRPSASVPSDIPKRFADIFGRIGAKDAVTLAVQQSFENLGPKVTGFLVDLRDLVVNSKTIWGKTGHISLAEICCRIERREPSASRLRRSSRIFDPYSPLTETRCDVSPAS